MIHIYNAHYITITVWVVISLNKFKQNRLHYFRQNVFNTVGQHKAYKT